MEQTLERRVRVIPATKKLTEAGSSRRGKQRVAAYCRVSTDSEEQLNSYEAQKAYYTQKIEENPDWELAGIFADKGLSGTSMKKRDDFKRMIAACKRGRIDTILTKSLSRFARNTVDCLDTIRMLRARGIGVIFEKKISIPLPSPANSSSPSSAVLPRRKASPSARTSSGGNDEYAGGPCPIPV